MHWWRLAVHFPTRKSEQSTSKKLWEENTEREGAMICIFPVADRAPPLYIKRSMPSTFVSLPPFLRSLHRLRPRLLLLQVLLAAGAPRPPGSAGEGRARPRLRVGAEGGGGGRRRGREGSLSRASHRIQVLVCGQPPLAVQGHGRVQEGLLCRRQTALLPGTQTYFC